MITRMPGGDVGRSSMSTAMLFAQPLRVPAEFIAEQHALGRRPGQLEASTAMARALFDVNGQREVLLDQLPSLTMPPWSSGVDATTSCPRPRPRPPSTACPTDGLHCSPNAGTCPTWSAPIGLPAS
jgi:hypothetical protein